LLRERLVGKLARAEGVALDGRQHDVTALRVALGRAERRRGDGLGRAGSEHDLAGSSSEQRSDLLPSLLQCDPRGHPLGVDATGVRTTVGEPVDHRRDRDGAGR
jgi:hypothetical protein